MLLILFVFSSSIAYAISLDTTAAQNVNDEEYYPNFYFSDMFDWRIFKSFALADNRNVLISPTSLKIILALLYHGTESTTKAEFEQALQFQDKKSVREMYGELLAALQGRDIRKDYLLRISSSIFMNPAVPLSSGYEYIAKNFFKAQILRANFSHPVEASRMINSWIEYSSNGNFINLIDADDLKTAVMFITNVIYFKGVWLHPFSRSETYNGTFYQSSNYNNVQDINQVRVEFIRTENLFYYGKSKELDCQILKLPYKGGLFSMFILLPNALGGLPHLVRSITLSRVSKLRYALEKRIVNVNIPKFKVSFKAKLTQTLKNYGLQEIFESNANLTGLTGVNSSVLFVTDILQTSNIEVDEEGSVASSVTDVSVGNKFGETTEPFNATHPFLFYIEGPNGTVLFIGTLDDPVPTTTQTEYPNTVAESQYSSSKVPAVNARLNPIQPNADINDAFYRFTYFDLELLNELGDSSTNVLVSPASLKSLLAMLLEGAGGNTAAEISEALRLNPNQDGYREIVYNLLSGLNIMSPGVTLKNENGVFTSSNVVTVDSYRKKLEQYYSSTFRMVDFGNSNVAAALINRWIANATNGIIKELVPERSLNADTKMVVGNALYFKGKWKVAFDPKNTYPKCFKTTNGCVTSQFMSISNVFNYNYINSLHAHVVEIPYEDNFSMLIVLPSERGSTRAVARDLYHTNLLDIVNNLRSTELILEIPKFQFEYSTDMVDHLQGLKIRDIFGPKANLSGIVPNGGVFVNSMMHKTKIDVDETGTEAAAATAAVIVPLIGTVSLVADKPFVFFIYQRPTANTMNIIFEGILQRP